MNLTSMKHETSSRILKASPASSSFLPDRLPRPVPKRSSVGKFILVVVVALLLVGGAAFWLTRDGETRVALREQAATVFDGVTQGTPLAVLSDVLRGVTPVSPEQVISPDPAASVQPQQAAVPKVTADTTVRPDFIEDLADYIVANYRPGRGAGSLSLDVQEINQHYGTKMTGLANSGGNHGNRAEILRYVFSPSMIQGLYGLYVDRFLEILVQRGTQKFFNSEQMCQLLLSVAVRSVVLSGDLEGVAAVPDIGGRLKKLDEASQSVVSVNGEMMQAVFDIDQLRENDAASSRIDEARKRMDNQSARCRRALNEKEEEQRTLAADIRKGGGQSPDDDSLLFLAQWVGRRLNDADTSQSLASVRSAAGVLRDLARRCSRMGDMQSTAATPPSASAIGMGRQSQ